MSLRRPFHVRRRAALGGLALLLMASLAQAHDFWLIPDAFAIAPNALLRLRGQTSSDFPTSLSAVAPDRIADARVLSAQEDVALGDLRASGTSLVVEHRPATAGQHVVVVALKPRLVRDAASAFRRYM